MEINTEKEVVRVIQEATISIRLSKKEAGVLAAIIGSAEEYEEGLNIAFLYRNLKNFVGHNEFNDNYLNLYKGILELRQVEQKKI